MVEKEDTVERENTADIVEREKDHKVKGTSRILSNKSNLMTIIFDFKIYGKARIWVQV